MKKSHLIILSLLGVCCMASAQDGYPTTYYPQQGYVPANQPPPDLYHTGTPAHRLGAGIILGEPVGGSLKYWLNEKVAVDAAAGFSAHAHSSLYLNGDILWHRFDLFDITPAPGKLPLYYGVGGLIRFRDHGRDTVVGVRVPIGVSYMLDNAPIDIFAEVGPAIDVRPSVKGELTGGIGARFWF